LNSVYIYYFDGGFVSSGLVRSGFEQSEYLMQFQDGTQHYSHKLQIHILQNITSKSFPSLITSQVHKMTNSTGQLSRNINYSLLSSLLYTQRNGHSITYSNTSCGYYSTVVFVCFSVSGRVATIRGQLLLKHSIYVIVQKYLTLLCLQRGP